MGADIFYECVGQDSFLITMNFYRDCDGTSAPTSATVDIESDICGISQSLTLTRTTLIQPQGIPNGSEVSALCNAAISQSTCNSSSVNALPGVEQYQYSGLFVASANCPDWTISYGLCCRNAQITTLNNPDSYDLYIEATLNNTAGICNNSPIFTNRPVPYFCYVDSIFYNHGTIDFDGDSLVYSLINPLDAANVNIPYVPGFSPTDPLSSGGTFTFDSTSGQMFFVPQQAEVAVVTILVEEYRNGVLVGSTMRDIQVIILGPPTCNPPYGVINNAGIDSSSVTGGVYTGPYDIEACPGDTVAFTIPMGGDSIYLFSNASTAINGATFDTTQFGIDSVVGEFFWVPTSSDTGFNIFSLSFGVNSCPVDRTSSRTVNITVLDGTDAGEDLTYCTEGDSVQLFVTGGNSFVWSPAAGLSNTNIRNPLAAPTVTTEYYVQSDLSLRCKNRDTVVVEVVPNFILDIQPQLDTVDICRNSLTQLEVTTDSAFGPYTFDWTPGNDLTDSTIANPLANPDVTTTYIATVTSDTGCTLKDTITIDVTGVGPQVFTVPDDISICPGDTTQLDVEVFPVTCGPAIGLGSCSPTNPPSQLSYGTGTSTSPVTPFAGNFSDGRYQVLYRSADLRAAGINAGTISRLRLFPGTTPPAGTFSDLSVKLGCTQETQLSRSAWLPTSVEVFSSANFLVQPNSFDIIFPPGSWYDWDGISNLVVEICFGNSTTTNAGGNVLLLSSNVSYPASMRATSATANGGCNLPASAIPTNEPVNQVPNITFFLCTASTPSYTYSWSPTTGLSDPTIPNPTAVITQPTIYTVTVSDTACDGSDFVTVDIDTTEITVPNDTVLCNADSVQLFVDVNVSLPVTCGSNGNTCNGAATTTTVGTGNNVNLPTDFPTPYAGFLSSSRAQYLYTAADLQAAGVQPGRISSLAFNVTSNAGGLAQYQNFTISMKCTNSAGLSVGAPESGTVTVFTPKTITLTNGWNTHNFDNYYDWDGQSNLIVEVCFANPFGSLALNAAVQSSNTGYLSSIYGGSLLGNACSGGPDVTDGASRRPNIRLTSCPTPLAYTIQWSPAATLTDATISNPIASPTATTTYSVTVTTPSGCIKTDSVTVGIGSLPYTITNDTTVCIGEQVQLEVLGTNLLVEWEPSPNLSCTTCPNPVVTASTGNAYPVVISDTANGCSVPDTVIVNTYPTPAGPFPDTAAVCTYDSLLVDAGTGFVSYNWSNGDQTQTSWLLPGDTYFLTATDANGCSVIDTITVLSNALPLVDLGNDTSLCEGDSVLLFAGQGYDSYSWTPGGSTTTDTLVFETGEYIVEVTDANGCSSSDSVNVFFNTVPVVELGNDTLLCFRDTLRLVAGNDPGYTYTWSDGSADSVLLVDQSFDDTIFVEVFGGTTCFAVDTIVVSFKPEVVFSIGADEVSCNGDSVTFFPPDTFATYNWSNGVTTDTMRTNVPGVYTLIVTDADGCAGVDTVELIDLSPQVDLGNDTLLCEGDSITLNAGGGFPSYNWNTVTINDSLVGVTVTGTYSVTVTDTAGCVTVDSIFVQFDPFPVINLGNDTTLCADQTLTLDAGYPGSTYLWSNGETTQTITTTFPNDGDYWVTVTTPAGCADVSDTINIEYLAPVTFSLGPDQNLCTGDTIELTADDEFADYIWSTNETTDTILVTTGGTYILTVTDIFGCQGVDTVIITDVSPNVSVADQNVCEGETATLDAGAGFASYIWSTGEQTQTITSDTAGTFSVTVTDANQCAAVDTAVVTVNPLPSVELTATQDTVCPNQPAQIDAGSGFVSYIWSTGDTNQVISLNAGGTFAVTVTDANGCSDADTITIGQYPGVSFDVVGFELCPDETDTLVGPAGYVSYQWRDTSGNSLGTDANLVVDSSGVYALSVIDANGCGATDTAIVTDVPTRLEVAVDPPQINAGENTTLSANLTLGSGNYSYDWTPAAGLTDASSDQPQASPTEETTYTVVATDLETGCVYIDSVTVLVFDSTAYAFPQAFTPNGDGSNDLFGMIATGDVELVEFNIYNRYGNNVHSQPVAWDGTYQGTEQPIGTYSFSAVINITTASGTSTETLQGGFTLLR